METVELGSETKVSLAMKAMRKCETMLMAMGIWYLVQILGIVPIINVAIPESVQEDMPKAKIVSNR